MGGSSSPAKFYEDAKILLENKDLVGFVSKITSAILLASNDKEMLARALYLQVEGLYKLKQHKKALKYIPEAIKCNTGEQILHLKKYAGVIHGYLGDANKAEEFLKEVLDESTDLIFLTKIYINLSWIYLTVEKEHKKYDEAKKYLDLAYKNFDLLPNLLKRKVCNNYSVYYYYQSNFNKSIELIHEAFNYAEEKDLPKLYNNEAEILLKYNGKNAEIAKKINECLDKSDVISSKFDDKIEKGFSSYIRAMLELQKGRVFSALDTLYIAFDYYTDAEAYTYSSECLLKINEISKNLKSTELLLNNRRGNISKIKFLQFNLCRHKELLEYMSQKLSYESNIEIMNLQIYEGVVHAYLGKFDNAVKTFKAVIDQSEDPTIITMSYLSLAWLYMGFNEKTFDNYNLEEAKKYLDYANEKFDYLSNEYKYLILFYNSIYYSFKKNYTKAIKILITSIQYCEEKYLAYLYNNIAELYIKSTDCIDFSENTLEYLKKAEVLGTKYNEALALGQTFFFKAEVELREDQFFKALDTLYLSFEYFKQAEETVLACECLLKINELMDEYKRNNLTSLKNNIKMGISNY